MNHALAFFLAQVLPPVRTAGFAIDPARTLAFTKTDWAVIAATATPVCTLAGSMIRRYWVNGAAIRNESRTMLEPLVWLNTRSGIYYFEGEHWYGRTQRGMLATRRFAERRGKRPSRAHRSADPQTNTQLHIEV